MSIVSVSFRSLPAYAQGLGRRLRGTRSNCKAFLCSPVPSCHVVCKSARSQRRQLAAACGPHEATELKCASEKQSSEVEANANSYCVINFYHLVDIEHPSEIAQEHKELIQSRAWDIRGRIYLSFQGVNAQFSGPAAAARAYTSWVASQEAFSGLSWREYTVSRHVFPRLRVQFKPNLISLQGGMKSLKVTDPSVRATPLSPSDWKGMLAEAVELQGSLSKGSSPNSKNLAPVLLDLRNSYEWDAGHFLGAERPAEEEFRETPRPLPGDEDSSVEGGGEHSAVPAPLRGKSFDTPVMMYCTGGIRCDVYSPVLRKQGFKNLYSLEGGVQRFLDEEGFGSVPSRTVDTDGPEGSDLEEEKRTQGHQQAWQGSLYVFDDRMAVGPGCMAGATVSEHRKQLKAAEPCALCGASAELPHVNCANVDCNLLFLVCKRCRVELQGCCSTRCRDEAPRLLRPSQIGVATAC